LPHRVGDPGVGDDAGHPTEPATTARRLAAQGQGQPEPERRPRGAVDIAVGKESEVRAFPDRVRLGVLAAQERNQAPRFEIDRVEPSVRIGCSECRARADQARRA
jgi:hypothetical protein